MLESLIRSVAKLKLLKFDVRSLYFGRALYFAKLDLVSREVFVRILAHFQTVREFCSCQFLARWFMGNVISDEWAREEGRNKFFDGTRYNRAWVLGRVHRGLPYRGYIRLRISRVRYLGFWTNLSLVFRKFLFYLIFSSNLFSITL